MISALLSPGLAEAGDSVCLATLIGHPPDLTPRDLSWPSRAATAAFLSSPLSAGITATTVYVDKGYHAMGMGAVQP